MNISAPFITRPVATTLLGFAVLLAGVMGFMRLSVSPLPQVDFPTIQVTTQLPGANPDTIASLVTASLERQFGQIPSLSTMSSQSAFGFSQITLQFDLDRDIDAAAQDVQSAINAAASTLPRNLPYPPVYAKVNPADTPIVTLTLRSQTSTLREMSDLADTQLAPRLSEVPGVGRVMVEGGVRPAIRIQADLARLAANHMSMDDLRLAIAGANVAGAKGSIDGARQSYTLDANDQLMLASEYRTIVVQWSNGRPIILSDVAKVVDGLENSRVGGWHNGEPAVVLDVVRQPGANIINTVELLKGELPKLRRLLPAGMSLDIVNDRTDTIRASIFDVEITLVIAIALVVMVVLLFLRDIRATIIAGISLPLSIVATFATMWAAGFSLDNLSLMALTIGTGFVVDDAIVMIENIVRNIEKGKTPTRAALDGAREIGFTVVSLTVSLIAVFIPLLFMTGIVGRMFREFALTLSMAVVVSAIVSLTLTPMLCGQLLRRPGREGRGQGVSHAAHDALLLARPILRDDARLGAEAPAFHAGSHRSDARADRRAVYFHSQGLPAAPGHGAAHGGARDRPRRIVRRDEEAAGRRLQHLPAGQGSHRRDSVLGVGPLNPTTNVGHFSITLRDRDDRADSADVIADRLKARAEKLAGAKLYIEPVQDIQITTRMSRSQYQYTITTGDNADLLKWSDKLFDAMRREPILRNVAAETQTGGLRSQVRIDRQNMGRLGVSMQNVDDILNDAFGQRQISTIYTQSNQYRVILEASEQYQRDPKALEKLYVASPGGGPQTPLGAIVHIDSISAPLSVSHQEQFPAATISFDLAPGASLGDALQAIARIEKDIQMPSIVVGSFSGDAAEFNKSLASEPYLILAAIIAIYVVLGVLYESFAHPFTVLTTLPSAGVGALARLDAVSAGYVDRRADRHRAADGHRQEERDHDDRFRAGDGALRGAVSRGVDRARLSSALSSDHDDDARGVARRVAVGARAWFGKRIAHAARHIHRRRPAAVANAHTLYDARHLSRRRAAAPETGRGDEGGRGGRRLATTPGPCPSARKRPNERLLAFHQTAGRHDAARPRAVPDRLGGLFSSARREPSGRRFSDDQHHRRRPGADPETMAASVAAPLERRLANISSLNELTSISTLGGTPSSRIRHRTQRRRGGARRAGGDQRRHDGPADGSGDAADLSQGQLRRRAGARSGADLGHAADERDLRRDQHRHRAADFAGVGVGNVMSPARRSRRSASSSIPRASPPWDSASIRSRTSSPTPMCSPDRRVQRRRTGRHRRDRRSAEHARGVSRHRRGVEERRGHAARRHREGRARRAQPSGRRVVQRQAGGDPRHLQAPGLNVIETVGSHQGAAPTLREWVPQGIDIAVSP